MVSEMLNLNFHVPLTSQPSLPLNASLLGEQDVSVVSAVVLTLNRHGGGHSLGKEDKDLPASLATSAVEIFWRFECTRKVTAGPSTLKEIIKKV